MVPWLAAPMRSGTTWARAPKQTSATRWDTSTLPAPTAAGGRASTTVPGRATTCTGRRAPPLAGRVGSTAERRANATDDTVTAAGAFTLPGCWGSEPDRSTVTPSPSMVSTTRMATGRCCAGSGPNESRRSSKDHRPSGRAARAARMRRSPQASTSSTRRAAAAGPPRPATTSASRAAPRTLAPTWASRSPARSVGVRLLASSTARTSGVRRTGGSRRPSSNTSTAPAGIEPGADPPTSAWWARLATHPTRAPSTWHGATTVMSLRWVPPANGSLTIHCWPGTTSPPASSTAASTAATDAGMAPRWTGMFSAWASSSPVAVNTADEQSARSLMLGLDADRRSTADISSATPSRRAMRTCRAAGSSGPLTASSAGPGPRRRPAGPPTPPAPRWCSPARPPRPGPRHRCGPAPAGPRGPPAPPPARWPARR